MAKELWTVSEILEILNINKRFLSTLEQEEIICPACSENALDKVFCFNELEKLRVAKILVEDMEVNLPGVEVILRMRQSMIDMRKQFDAILGELARDLEERLKA
ncbi:MAG: chaperone modulator CbpM [Thermodesulfobacteriota bacterium]|nr:chaperone modulator CbpM [Thermodesulfobacteriota bacterium]